MENISREHSGVRLKDMFLVVIIFALVTIYATIAFSTGDLLWFASGFQEKPNTIMVYYQGEKVEYRPGDEGFDELANAVQESLDNGIARQSGIGLSDESLQDAYSKNLTLEAFFARPVKLHAWFSTGEAAQMLFPITGRHSELSVVFLGNFGKYNTNAPALKTNQPLRDALRALGYE